MRCLVLGEIRVDPEPVADGEVGHGGNGEGLRSPLELYINSRPGEIEWRRVSKGSDRGKAQEKGCKKAQGFGS